MEEIVKPCDSVIVQRQSFMKVHRLGPKNMECRLGQDTIDLSPVIGEPYWSTYKMDVKSKAKRVFMLKKCSTSTTFSGK